MPRELDSSFPFFASLFFMAVASGIWTITGGFGSGVGPLSDLRDELVQSVFITFVTYTIITTGLIVFIFTIGVSCVAIAKAMDQKAKRPSLFAAHQPTHQLPYQNRNTEYRNPFEESGSRPVERATRRSFNLVLRDGDRVIATSSNPGELVVSVPPPPSKQQPTISENPGASDVEAGEGEESCVVCLVHKRNHVTIPCGHLSLCGTCVGTGKIKTCPTCRKPDITMMRVYGD